MFCILMPGLLLPMLALKMDRVEKKGGKKVKIQKFQNLRLSMISISNPMGAKVLSALASISDNTVHITTCRISNLLPLVNLPLVLSPFFHLSEQYVSYSLTQDLQSLLALCLSWCRYSSRG